jgi:hypothetical protein
MIYIYKARAEEHTIFIWPSRIFVFTMLAVAATISLRSRILKALIQDSEL